MEQKNYTILEKKKNIKAKDKYSHSFYKKNVKQTLNWDANNRWNIS